MRVNGMRFPWWITLFVVISLIMFGVATFSVVTIFASFPVNFARTPFEYTQRLFQADNPVLCPGDHLEFEYGTRTLTDPDTVGLLLVIDSFVSKNEPRLYVPAGEPRWLAGGADIEGTFHASVRVPDLPAGEYEYRRAAALPPSSANPAFFLVNFSIPPTCE